MKVCIVGGGNIGSILLTDFSVFENVEVHLLTGNKESHSGTMTKLNTNQEILSTKKNIKIFEEPEDAYKGVSKVFFTLPKNVLFLNYEKYIDSLPHDIDVYFIPGSGGIELFANSFHQKNIQVVGFQRVHSIARIKQYGKSVYELDRKTNTSIAFFPNNISLSEKKAHQKYLEHLIQMPVKVLHNYLSVSLVPSNAILHTSRVYDLFYDYSKDQLVQSEEPIYFYRNWTLNASDILLKADDELQALCKGIDSNILDDIPSLKVHYESNDKIELTQKIKSIHSFKNILAPVVEIENSVFKIDTRSRYFTEDFEYSLFFIYLLSDFLKTPHKTIKKLILWYSQFVNKNIVDFKLYSLFHDLFGHTEHTNDVLKDFYQTGNIHNKHR